jgi:chromosome segregation ATPase
MKLFNQTDRHLKWDLAGRIFVCAPWGDIDVPDDLVSNCKRRKLPLAATQVPPELKAEARVDAEKAAAKADALFKMTERAEAAEATLALASEELETVQRELAAAKAEAAKYRDRINDVMGKLRTAEDDKRAIESKLAAVAKQNAELESAEKQRKTEAERKRSK